MVSLFSRLVESLPTQCLMCRAWAREPVCAHCAADDQPAPARCSTCALPLAASVAEHSAQCGACITTPPPLAACFAAVSYLGPWIDCVSSYKFHSNPGLARYLARRMQRAHGVGAALAECDVLLPVPLSRERLAQRGYNQALELAKPLARWAARPLDAHSLVRLRDTPPQRTLKRPQRLANVKGAFAVLPECTAAIKSRRVLLVDDVMTSGASLHAAAQALLQAGAHSVTGLVFARTGMEP
jgi:ComF family protein